MKISIEYSPGRASVAVYGQRYGGTIKPTSPEACGMPHLARSIRNASFSVLVSLTNVGYLSSSVNVLTAFFV